MDGNSYKANIEAVIMSFNQGSMVLEAVESLCAQTVLPQRIVIMDDGATEEAYDSKAHKHLSKICGERITKDRSYSGFQTLQFGKRSNLLSRESPGSERIITGSFGKTDIRRWWNGSGCSDCFPL